MSLKVRITGIDELFNATKFYCRRKHGQVVEFGITLNLDFAQGNRLDSLAEKLWEGGAIVEILWDENAISPKLEICEAKTLDNAVSSILIKAYYKIPEYKPGCFVPRKRILKADNFLQLLENNFDDLVQWENSVANALNGVRFLDAKKTNHIQDGLTDYEMLERLISSYNQMEAPENALLLSGITKEKWQLTWLQEKKYIDLNLIQERRIDDLINNGLKPLIKMNHAKDNVHTLFKQNKPITSITYIFNWGNFESQNWENWYKKNLPAFYQNKFVHEITDYFNETGDKLLNWESFVTIQPHNVLIGTQSIPVTPWVKIGKISQRSTKSHWLEAELEGFESGFNKVDIRLTTPYSGKSGDNGFHLVPEEGTEVLLIKGSCWNGPILLTGNVRSKEITHEAPFWKLEQPGLWNFNDLNIKTNNMEMEHNKDLKISANSISIKSIQKTQMEAMELKASAKTKVEITATAALKVSGNLVDFEGQAMLNAKAPIIKLN